jgi:hypothetical protein
MNRVMYDEPFAWGGDKASIHTRWEHKHNMPFAAIAGAIGGALAGTFAGGVAAAAAVGITGTVASVVGGIAVVAQVAMYAGLAMTAVGAITGNKDLMKIGGYVGMAGGVGSLAIGAMGAVGGALGTTASTVTGTGFNAAATAAPVTQAAVTAPLAAQAPVVATEIGTAAGQVAPAAQTGMLSTTGATQATGVLGSTANDVAASSAITPAVDTAKFATTVGDAGATTAKAVGTEAGKTVGGGFFDFIKSDAGSALIKVGGGMLSGSAEEDMNKKTYKLNQQNQAFNQMVSNREYANYNSLPGNMNGVDVSGMTPEQIAQAQQDRTNRAIFTAKAITKAAGTK